MDNLQFKVGQVGSSQVRNFSHYKWDEAGCHSVSIILELRQLEFGAHVAGMFMGAACYADDIVLIAPCHQAMQIILNTLEDFAARHNISFSIDPVPANLTLCDSTFPG